MTSGSLCGHRHVILLASALPFSAASCVPGQAWHTARDCWVCPTALSSSHFIKVRALVSFRLINVQFSIYYEPPGFNYYTITQSIPCHLIFMAFIMPLSVQLPGFILEEFHLISWVCTIFSFVWVFIYLGVCFLLCVCSNRTACPFVLFLFPAVLCSFVPEYSVLYSPL